MDNQLLSVAQYRQQNIKKQNWDVKKYWQTATSPGQIIHGERHETPTSRDHFTVGCHEWYLFSAYTTQQRLPTLFNGRTIRYDMVQYDTIYLRALKSWRDGQPNLAHGTETKKNKNIWKQ